MARSPSDARRPATPPGSVKPRGHREEPPHDPAPVDLGNESVAGEEDPGASAEPPSAESPEREDRGPKA